MTFDLYNKLFSDDALSNALANLDVEITKLDLRGSKSDLSTKTAASITTFARDAAGGHFAVWHGGKERVVYFSSEGESGVVADSIEQMIVILVNFPFAWHDLIRCSGSKRAMMSQLELIEEEILEELDVESKMGKYFLSIGIDPGVQRKIVRESTEFLAEKLSITTSNGLVEEFFDVLNQKPSFIAVDKAGNEFNPLSD